MKEKATLMIVNSVYQLFTALHIRHTLLRGKQTELLLTDLLPGASDYTQRLQESRLFERILYAKTAKLCRQYVSGEAEKIKEGYEKTDSIFRWILNDEPADYEAVYFANFDTFSRMLACRLYERHPQFIWYEDGFSSYVIDYLKEDRAMVNRTEEGKKIGELVTNTLLYEPRLAMRGDGIPNRRLPKVSLGNQRLRECMNAVFAYQKPRQWEDFLFLEQSFRAEGITTNDLSLMEECRHTIGEGRFLVKPHPRNKENTAFEQGLTRKYDCDVPLELILLNGDARRWNLLTVCSNAALTGRLVFGLDIPTVMLYRLFLGKVLWKEDAVLMRYLRKFWREFSGRHYYVPGTVYELRNILEYLGGR